MNRGICGDNQSSASSHYFPLEFHKTLKILLITGDFPPVRTGDASHALYLALHLAWRGNEVHVLTSAIKNVARDPSITVHPVMKSWNWFRLPKLIRLINRLSPDAILCFFDGFGRMYGRHPMMTFAPFIAKKLNPSIRFVTQFETPFGINYNDIPFKTRVVRKLIAWLCGAGGAYRQYGTLLRDSDHLIILSELHLPLLTEEFYDKKDNLVTQRKSSLIPPPPCLRFSDQPNDSARVKGREQLGLPADAFLFLYYGYIYPEKCIETLLHAFRSVVTLRPEVRLVLVGSYGVDPFNNQWTAQNRKYLEAMKDLAKNLSISPSVIWAGPCEADQETASLFFHAADVCVLPFEHGVRLNNSSFASAAGHELPIITNGSEVLEKQFLDKENVFLCPPRNPQALALAMDSLMRDPAQRNRLRNGVRALVHEWFSWDRAIDRTLQTLNSDILQDSNTAFCWEPKKKSYYFR